MTKHIADHRAAPKAGRMIHFLRIARAAMPGLGWVALHQKPVPVLAGNRRTVEFARIERGREA